MVSIQPRLAFRTSRATVKVRQLRLEVHEAMAKQKEASCLDSAATAVGSIAIKGNKGQVSNTAVGVVDEEHRAQDGGSMAASFGVVQSFPYVGHN